MARGVHAVVKDANNDDAEVGEAQINHVPLDAASAVAGANVVTGACHLGRLRQFDEGRNQGVDIAIRLG